MIMIGFQMGRVFTNFLIAFFAEAYELHSFIEIGTKFHALIPSFMNVFLKDQSDLIVLMFH